MTGFFYALDFFCVRFRSFVKKGEISMTLVWEKGEISGSQPKRGGIFGKGRERAPYAV